MLVAAAHLMERRYLRSMFTSLFTPSDYHPVRIIDMKSELPGLQGNAQIPPMMLWSPKNYLSPAKMRENRAHNSDGSMGECALRTNQ